MFDKKIDLHLHTMYSDGSFRPAELIELAKKRGVGVISITDHDITDGIEEAVSKGLENGIEVIPGIELSAEFENVPEGEIHILGYFIDCRNKCFQQKLEFLRQRRFQRAKDIFYKLFELGVKIKEDSIFLENNRHSIGRLHFAKLMVKEGFVRNIREAFDLYLSNGRPAYVPKLKLSAKEAIEVVQQSGGVPVLAHPYYGNCLDGKVIRELVDIGLAGLEVYYYKHPKNVIEELLMIAEKYDLLITGGSDCHGILIDGDYLLGKADVPSSILEKLKKYKVKIDESKCFSK